MKMQLYSTHPLIKMMIDIDVKQSWIAEYFKFHFRLSTISQPYDDILYIRENGNGTFICSYEDRVFETEPSIEFITTRITSWVLGITNDMLFKKNIYVLHGAACVYKNQTLLFLGNKGTGKSTLLYKILVSGGGFLADDNIYFSLDNNNVYYSDLGIRIKNGSKIQDRCFEVFPVVLNGIQYIQPQNRFFSSTKPDKIYFLTKEAVPKESRLFFSDFAKMVIPNIKNSNSGVFQAISLFQSLTLTEIKIINAFEIKELDAIFD